MGTIVSVAGAVEQTSRFASKLMDKLPDYPQKKKEQYAKLKKRYKDVRDANFPNLDDNEYLDIRDELFQFHEDFYEEISS